MAQRLPHLHHECGRGDAARPPESNPETPVADLPIDVWDVESFDPELAAHLAQHADLMAAYYARSNQIFLDHDHGRARTLIRPENAYAAEFSDLRERVGDLMDARTIRAWHYTRLTDGEAETLSRAGIHLSTPDSLRRRFDAIVAEGYLTAAETDHLWRHNMFTHQHASRAGKFWAVSHPQGFDDLGVVPLMKHWGGEAASMWMKDKALLARLERIGQARVLGVAMPLAHCEDFGGAGRAVIATFARARGAIAEPSGFDLYVRTDLPASAILEVCTEGEASFTAMAQGYPAAFVDHGLTYWKDLTGEDD